MMKKLSLLILGLFVLSFVLAQGDLGIQTHDPVVSLDSTTPSTVYEYNLAKVKINVNNNDSSTDDIKKVTIIADTSNFSIIEGKYLSGWSVFVSGNNLTWEGSSSSISPGFSGPFYFNISVADLLANANENLQVITTDTTGTTKVSTIILPLNNDAIAPTYLLNSPANFSIHKPETMVFNTTISESESGFASAGIAYDWDVVVGSSTKTGYTALTDSGNGYVASIDLNEETAKNYFGFFFNITDKAGNDNPQVWQYVFIDREDPVVTLTTPADGTIISASAYNYSFNVGDNAFSIDTRFSPNVTCTVYIDDVMKNSNMVTSNSSVSLSASLSGLAQGSHYWYGICQDSAGRTKTSATQNFILDTEGPSITLTSHSNNAVVNNNTSVQFSITDAYAGVDNATARWVAGANFGSLSVIPGGYSLTTMNLNSGSNTLEIYVNDTVMNSRNSNFTLIVDDSAPAVTLGSPVNSSMVNTKTINFTAVDAYSSSFSCSLNVDGILDQTTTTSNNTIASVTITAVLTQGNHDWYVNCTDNVDNLGTSNTYSFTYDTVLPGITVYSPTQDQEFTVNNADVNYKADDANIQSCWWDVDGGAVNAIACNSNITCQTWADGRRNVSIYANDSAGNTNSTSISFFADTAVPVLTYTSSTTVDGSFQNNNTITIEVTSTEVNPDTLLFTVYDSTGALVNSSLFSSLSTASFPILITFSQTDGSYYFNATVDDIVGNKGATATRNVVIDTIAPALTLRYPDNTNGYSLSNINTAGNSDFTYSFNEVNPNRCVLYVNNALVDNQTAGTNFSSVALGVAARNSPYDWKIICDDSAGNSQEVTGGYIYYDTINPI